MMHDDFASRQVIPALVAGIQLSGIADASG